VEVVMAVLLLGILLLMGTSFNIHASSAVSCGEALIVRLTSGFSLALLVVRMQSLM
jgi:hypothetical protein